MEVYNMCSNARDGMSGALDYSTTLKIMDIHDINKEDQLLLLKKVVAVEDVRMNNRNKKKKKEDAFNKAKAKSKTNKRGR